MTRPQIWLIFTAFYVLSWLLPLGDLLHREKSIPSSRGSSSSNNSVCDTPLLFRPARPNQGVTYLVSFPGSGNNWVLNQITAGTRLFPCSVYNETRMPFPLSRCSITKTHFPMYHMPLDNLGEAQSIVLILRNPFDAILAELFRRSNGRKYMRTLAERFPPLALKWKEFVQTNLNQAESPKRLVLFYEDFKADREGSLLRLFEFLKQSLGEDMPIVEDATLCALKFDAAHSMRGRTKSNVFANPKFQNLTRLGCATWKDLWVDTKWGECMDLNGRHFSRDVGDNVS